MESSLGAVILAGLVVIGAGLIARNKTINDIGVRMFFSGASTYFDNPILHTG